MHKNPVVGRPIVAGYNWVTTSASKFVAHNLGKFVTNFQTILKTLYFKTMSSSFNKDIRLASIFRECFKKHLKKCKDFNEFFQHYDLQLCSNNASNLRSLLTKTKMETVK